MCIRDSVSRALSCESIDIVNESHLHAGHAGAASGGGHFRITVVAEEFAGLGTLARHRLIYDAVAEEMKQKVHALSINALAPDEFD